MKLYKIFSIWEFLIFIFFIILALLLVLFYFNNNSLNEKGITALKSKDFLTAQKYFKQNVESGSLDNRSYLNLALSYDFLNQPLKAFEIYKIVSDSKNKNLGSFFSYFNQAELYGRLGNLEGALKHYQLTLEFGQKEKEIKTNIELLFKQKEQKGKQGSKSENSDSKNQSSGSDSQSTEGKKGDQSLEDKKREADKDQSSEDKGKDQEENQSKENAEEQQAEGKKDEDQNTSAGGQSEENQNKDQQKAGSGNQSEEEGQNKQKALTEREQKAILEEVQKQENKVRTRFYQNKRTFGDKTGKDW